MRLTQTCVCSIAHLPAEERRAFDELIARSPRRRGRICIDHPVLSIEAHQFGFAIHLGLLDDQRERPSDVSEAVWDLMLRATTLGAHWLSFDADEEPTAGVPVFRCASPGDQTAQAALPLAIRRHAVRCATCSSPDVVCDASVQWDLESQSWRLARIFDAAWCDICERDVQLERSEADTPVPAAGQPDA